MLSCFRCGSKETVKNGFMEGQQRYKCKECNYNFVNKPRRGFGFPKMAFVAWLYLQGMSQRRIAELVGVSSVAVSKWVREFVLRHKSKFVRRGGQVTVLSPNEIEVFIKGTKVDMREGKVILVLEDSTFPKAAGIVIDVNKDMGPLPDEVEED